jgi:ubiquinone/menaquinone biosynthesis C-methylase UbiE
MQPAMNANAESAGKPAARGHSEELATPRQVLEVGCGAGHWTRAYAPFLAREATIMAVDRDPKWSEGGAPWMRSLAEERGAPVLVQSGDACALPFADGSFDFVTCQTVLIHVDRPERALREMLRVLRPGGLLLCAEPDNLSTFAGASSLHETDSVEERVAEFRYALTQQRGRMALGQGNLSLGGRLPAMFATAGFAGLRVHLSDKAVPIYPTYEAPEQRAVLGDTEKWLASGVDFTREEARQRHLAGGGMADEFEAHWARELARRENYRDAVRRNAYDSGGGCVMYLVSGYKPQA